MPQPKPEWATDERDEYIRRWWRSEKNFGAMIHEMNAMPGANIRQKTPISTYASNFLDLDLKYRPATVRHNETKMVPPTPEFIAQQMALLRSGEAERMRLAEAITWGTRHGIAFDGNVRQFAAQVNASRISRGLDAWEVVA